MLVILCPSVKFRKTMSFTNLRHKSSAQIFSANLRRKSSVGLPSQMVEPQPPNYINVPDKLRWIEAP